MSTVDVSDMVGKPIWAKVAHRLTEQVDSGRWKAGDSLPSRRELAEEFGVALKTVNHAISELIEQGILGATSRVATFVPAQATRRKSAAAPTDTVPERSTAGRVQQSTHSLAGRRLLVLAALQDGGSWQKRDLDEALDFWTESVLHQAEASASLRGGHMVFCPVWPADGDHFATTLHEALALHRPEAVAIISLFAGDDAWARVCAEQIDCTALPAIFVSTVFVPESFPYLTYDQRNAGFCAARHLLNNGYERIVFFDLGSGTWVSERLAGVRDGCKNTHLQVIRPATYGDISVLQGVDTAPTRIAVSSMLAQAEASGALTWDGTTAVVVPADEFALLVLDQVEAAGRRAGRDLGIIGFDDLKPSRNRGLSTIRPPFASFGRGIVDFFSQALSEGPGLHQAKLAPELLARASTFRQ